MNQLLSYLDFYVIWALAKRTFRQSVESPIAYIVTILFYGFLGGIIGPDSFIVNQASIDSIGSISPWLLWVLVPALTMGLISEELRSGTFEQLTTLPVRDWEVVLGKFLGFALLGALVIGCLIFYPLVIMFLTDYPQGLDWGSTLGLLAGLYLVVLAYGAMGLFASSLFKNQIVAFISGFIFTTIFFFIGQFSSLFPGFLGLVAEFTGVLSHLQTLSKGVWDIRDLLYFTSLIAVFLYLSVQKLATRRF